MSGHIAKIIIEKGSVNAVRGEQSVELSNGEAVYLNEELHLSKDGLAVIAFNNGKEVYLNNAHLDFTCDFESLVLKDVLNAQDQSIEDTLLAMEQMEYMNTAFGLDSSLFSSFTAYMELYSIFTATQAGGFEAGYEAYSNIDDKSAINEVLVSYLSDNINYESLMSDLAIDSANKAAVTNAVEQDIGNVLEGLNNISSSYDQGILTAGDLIQETQDILNNSSFIEEYSDSVGTYTDSIIDTVQGSVSAAIEYTGDFAKDGLVFLSTTIVEQIGSLLEEDPLNPDVEVDLSDPLAGVAELTSVGDPILFDALSDTTEGADFIKAGDGYDKAELLAGNDKLIIGDANDSLVQFNATEIDAGKGDDVVQFGSNWDKVDFGEGDDILVLDDSLDFSALDTIVSNLEYIYLKAEASLENLSSQDLLDITDEDHILNIIGEDGATFTVSDDWLSLDHEVGENNITYHAQVQNTDLTLIVQNELMIDAS